MKVKIASPLLSYTKGKGEVDAEGNSVDQITKHLDGMYPGIRFRMIDEQDQIRPHIKIFVNGRQTQDLNAEVSEKDKIAIIQAFSGG